MSDVKVYAAVAGVQITDKEVDEFINGLGPQYEAYRANPEFRGQVVNQLVTMQLLAQKALELKIDESEEFLELTNSAKMNILASLAQKAVLDTVVVTEEEAAAYYEANKDHYKGEETVSAKHILVDDEAKCAELIAAINAGEKTFEEAAMADSTCPSGQKGGDLGTFKHGQMVAEFDQAAFAAEVDTIVGPIKTQFGYHAIKVYAKTTAEVKPYEAVASQAMAEATKEKQTMAMSKVLEEMGKKYL